jgi:hypothetical protein
MNVNKTIKVTAFMLTAFLAFQRVVFSQVASPTPDYEEKIRELQEELNQLEIRSQMAEGKAGQNKKSTFGLTGGSFEQDFESNASSWGVLQGQTLNLKFFANPADNLKANLNLQLWGYVANDLTQFEDLNNLANQNIFFTIRELDVTFDTGDFSFQAFKGMGYGGYYYSHDDFYSLFPDTWDVDKPFRYTGNSIPLGMSVKGERDFDGFEAWFGPQLQWGAQPEAYLMYQNKIGNTTLGAIEKLQITNITQPNYGLPFLPNPNNPIVGAPGVPVSVLQNPGQAVTNVTTTELYWKVPIGDSITLDNVGLYDPSQINYPYTYVQSVASGAGTLGTNYNIINANTTQTDALGYQGKLTLNLIPVVDTLILSGEYSGILAGDRERLSGEIVKNVFSNALLTVDATWQQPLIGPNPEIVDRLGNVIITPRNPLNDAFSVTSNPISGFNDRAMTQFKLSFVFNPGNGWFFRWNPNDFGGYNINTEMDTPFSFGIMGTLTNYSTGTDGFTYVNNLGVLVPDFGLGQAPTNGYQPYITSWTMWRTGGIHWILGLEGGYSQSALSYNAAAYPYTNSFSSSLTARINNTNLTLGYGYANYGPEDWHRQFGDLLAGQYLAQVTQKFGNSAVSLKYVEWDKNDTGTPPGSAGGGGQIGPVTSLLYNITLPVKELYGTYSFNF